MSARVAASTQFEVKANTFMYRGKCMDLNMPAEYVNTAIALVPHLTALYVRGDAQLQAG